MGVNVAPGVYVREIDLSLYVPALSTTIVGMVGRSTKGPTNERTYITNQQQFVEVFGEPDSAVGYESFAALQYLRRGRQLWFVRVVGGNAAKSSGTFQFTEPRRGNTVNTDPNDVLTAFAHDDGGGAVIANFPIEAGSVYLFATIGGDVYRITDDGAGVLSGTGPTGPIVGTVNYTNGQWSLTFDPGDPPDNGTDITALAESTNGEVISTDPDDVKVAFASTDGGANELTEPDLNGNVVDPGSVVITATVAAAPVTITDDGNGVLSGTIGANVVTGTINYTSGAWTLTFQVGDEPDNATNITCQYDCLKDVFDVEATSEGEWGDNVSLVIEDGDDTDSFKLTVYYSSNPVERYNNLVMDSASDNFVETKVNGVSDYIEITAEAGLIGYEVPDNVSATALTGGDTDAGGVTSTQIIGEAYDAILLQATGLQMFASPYTTDINLLAAPGWSDAAVVQELIAICETRADCMAIIDPRENLKPSEVVDWHNGQGAYVGSHAAFNSSYAALYWPWVKVYDVQSSGYIMTPPSGHVLAVYAYNDQVGESWYAPAGLNRGRVLAGIDLEYDPTLGDMELMYGDGNAVNPIERWPQDGMVVWGQRTLQRTPTALDRVNVRRLLLYIRKVISTAVRALVFEPNDERTWRLFGHLTVPFLNDLAQRRGLYDFRVKCDETTNTPEVIDRNELKAQIFLKPVKAAEFIQVDLVITRTGTNFDEILY